MQTGIIINLWPNCKPGFLLMLFVLFCKTWMLLTLGWDGWMVSLTQWTWVWVSSKRWWWTGKPGVLQSMGSQRVRHDWVTELNWTELKPGAWLARPPSGAQQSQDSSAISSSFALTAGSHSQSGQCPGRLEARSEAFSALSLKPKQDYLFNFPVGPRIV